LAGGGIAPAERAVEFKDTGQSRVVPGEDIEPDLER
jgi:hypothetical protein